MSIRTAARFLLGYAALVEGSAAMVRYRERTAAFRAAIERAAATERHLVVIGDPDAGFHTRLARAYGCGDVCVDLNGCPKCPVTVVADITAGPIAQFQPDSAVVFVSCVLEYVKDLDAALAEIARIAGSADNVFIVTVQPWTFTARLYPNARWRGAASPGAHVEMRPISLDEKMAASGALGLLAAAAFWPRSKRRG